ncbi:MAG: response regulator transcription factor [Elusimicrobia bacterium]|nr:response regulator transcription factor [Elusimicrobiota bacterium]
MKKKLLLIDDDIEISSILQEALEAAGYQFKLCDNGGEALKAILEYKPDLLLLDVMLPGLDGYSLAVRITGDAATRDLPIIVLSGLEPSGVMFKQFPQVAAFMTKPFDPAELLEAVRKALP